MTAGLILRDDIGSISFVDNSTYKLLDESFEMKFPALELTKHRKYFYAGRDIVSSDFGPRKVSFAFLVVGTTDANADAGVNAISKMIIRNLSDTYASGGQYNKLYLDEGYDTGDNGLILRVKFNNYTENIDTESWKNAAIESITTSGYYTLKVITAELEVERGLFDMLRLKYDVGSTKYFRECVLTLECEPFILGPARILTDSYDISADLATAGFSNAKAASIPMPYNLNSGYENSYNKFVIPAADIVGDAPMLTRFRVIPDSNAASAVVIARDAGISLLNSPSVPERISGTSRNDIFTHGDMRNAEGYSFRIQTNTSAQYRTSDDDGSTWTSYANIVPGNSHQIKGSGGETYNAYVVFPSNTAGVYSVDTTTWTVKSNQSYLPGNGSTTYASLTNSLFNGTTGEEIDEIQFNIPSGCYSKYAVFANIVANGRHEYKMKVRYFSPGNEATWSYTEDNSFVWTTMGDRNYNDCVVNLGMIDVSPRGMPVTLHPETIFMGEIKILVRNLQYASTPSGSIEVRNIWLVPIQDTHSMMYAAWGYQGDGVATFSNYDPSNPYRAIENRSWLNPYSTDDEDHPMRASIPLDGTMAGNIPTLIPGVDNTIMILTLGTFASLPDWRAKNLLPTNAKVITFGIAGRPRYLSIPGA